MFSNVDNISIVLSLIAVSLSLSTAFPAVLKGIKEYKGLNVKVNELELEQEKLEQRIKCNVIDANNYYIKEYIKILYKILCEIYPKTIFNISLKIIVVENITTSMDRKVLTWLSFPQKEQQDVTYTIENNTRFYSIIEKGNEYFFVSDLKEYSCINTYENEDKEFLNKYNTSIVCPIRKKWDNKHNNIKGFLCVDSPQKLKNVKKNERVINSMKSSASVIYDFLDQYKGNFEFYH